jgi:hypothetical protein
MTKNPNAPGGSNRQGPKVTKQGKTGPIISNWSLNQGTSKSPKGNKKPGGR